MTEQLQVYQGVLQGLTLIEVMAVQALILYLNSCQKIPIIGYTRIWHTGTSISLDRQIIFRSIAYSVYSTPYAKEIFKWGIGNPL